MSAIRDGSTELSAYGEGRLIHRSGRHVIYSARHPIDGSPVVIKMTAPQAPAELVSALRHEYEILSELAVPGVVRALDLLRIDDGLALVLRNVGALSLRDRLAAGPLALGAFLELAIQLAGVLGALHDAHVIHRDLEPGNILLDPLTDHVSLIDFETATSAAIASPLETSPWELEGSLSYMSPEQTGRTGRSVDHRTDLYALGAIFYELLSGSAPFAAADAAALVQAHLTRLPEPLGARHPEVPPLVSDIVLKLLAKDPEARYQTARGLERDLRHVAEQLAAIGSLRPFDLGRFDRPATLQIPEKLYGRTFELAALGQALARFGGAGRELVLVAGAPGIGKSSLVGAALPATRHAHGAIATGKFDQLQRSVPYAGLAHAFRQLLRRLLSAPEQALALWRTRLRAAIGPNGGVVADLVPELLELLGPQPPVAELEPAEARNRFHMAFVRFAGALATPEQPLLLFLDDLQWADHASLSLIATLAADGDSPSLQIVGAYRDTELGADHPLALVLADLRQAGVKVRTIHLRPLVVGDVVQLCQDTLGAGAGEVGALAALLHRLTAGNPFFIRQLMRSLVDAGLLRFDADEGRWRWDMEALERIGLSGDVVELMVKAIDRLPDASRTILNVAASLGNRVELGLLATATGLSRTAVAHDLWPAVEAGLVHPLQDTYRMPHQEGPFDERLVPLKAVYQFAHDQVQQAAYSLLLEAERQSLHLRIGRVMHATRHETPDQNLFDTVDHLNLAAGLITESDERLDMAALNLEAGVKAKASAAYAAALAYADAGMAALSPDAWTLHPELTFALYRLGAQGAYLSGDPGRAERLVALALAHAPSLADTADLYNVRIVAAATAGDQARALELGRECLALFGVDLYPDDLGAAVSAEMAAVKKNLGARRVEDLLDAPEVADPGVRACMRLLSNLHSPAYMTDPGRYALIASMMVNLSAQHGRTIYTVESYVLYALVLLRAAPDNEATAFAFANTAVAMARDYDSPGVLCRAVHVFATILNHWQAPLASSIALDREAFRAGLECGELQFAGFATFSIAFNLFELGTPLDEVLQACDEGLAFGAKIGNKLVLDMQTAYRQAVLCLQGLTDGPTSFEDAAFVEARFLDSARGAQMVGGHYEILRLRVNYLLGDQLAARRFAQSCAERTAYVPGVFASAEQVYYRGLNLAALYPTGTPEEQAAWAPELAQCQARLAQWALHAPANFQHKADLLAAERARVTGQSLEALRLYEQAIVGAEAATFTQDEALANELAGRFCLSSELGRLARTYMLAASAAYTRWGAVTKVAALEREFPAWLPAERKIARAVPALASDLKSVLSHELRNPLTGINGAALLLQEGRAGALNAQQAELAAMIGEQSARLKQLLDELLDT